MADGKYISELRIYKDEQDNIFNTDKIYQIPLYQRPFAWEDRQLIQLLEDIHDCGNKKYYLGSLIVADKGNVYEVVDGQQRLTALFLLLSYLKKEFEPNLQFACRDKSNYTLANIRGILDNVNGIDEDNVQDSIVNGMKILDEQLSDKEKYRADIEAKLARVVMYRIVVPPYTNLNRYFETMNTRGEQLEQHDILKAQLMSFYEGDISGQNAFAAIWDACRDMNGYVQMHFSTGARYTLFGGNWEGIPTRRAIQNLSYELKGNDSKNILQIIAPDYSPEQIKVKVGEKDEVVRFESIIDFQYFLLHCLKVYVSIRNIKDKEGNDICDALLDDKKLLVSFDRVINTGIAGGRIPNKKEFAKGFIHCLLKTRMLFDMCIIKREFVGDNTSGEWSLKTLHMSKEKAYFSRTYFRVGRERYSTSDRYRHPNILMLQSALRVSYTSPKVMHWITDELIWLSSGSNYSDHLDRYLPHTEEIAKTNVKEGFFDVAPEIRFNMGVNTPHIVFNYLDYLLWVGNRAKYADFVFEFRNSVEHWYPRNPSETELKKWDQVDRFGNLCIIQREVNSKFSNLPPEGKKISYKPMIEKGSLKLREMSVWTAPEGADTGSTVWKEKACMSHEQEMLHILANACGVDID